MDPAPPPPPPPTLTAPASLGAESAGQDQHLLQLLPDSALELAWQDDFDQPGAPDPARWGCELGLLRNREAQYYTAEPRNVRVEGGLLVIESHREPVPNPHYDPAAPKWPRNLAQAAYSSASVYLRPPQSIRFGRVAVRAKLPAGRGTWPAIWTLGRNINEVGWPRCGEIDILEAVGHLPERIHATVHTAAYNHVKRTHRGHGIQWPGSTTEFNVYAVDWTPQRLVFSCNGRPYFVFTNEGTGEDAWPFDQEHGLKLNLAIGGDWGGQEGIDESIFPVRFEIDWVRYYRLKEGPTPVAP